VNIFQVAIAILTFSSLVYFAEKEDKTEDENGNFKDTSWTFVESFWYFFSIKYQFFFAR